MDTIISKWNHIYSQTGQKRYPPIEILAENDFLLPITGSALDVACGLGANAIFLAERGLTVTAWDISFVAIEQLKTYAVQQGLNINACQENIVANSFYRMRF